MKLEGQNARFDSFKDFEPLNLIFKPVRFNIEKPTTEGKAISINRNVLVMTRLDGRITSTKLLDGPSFLEKNQFIFKESFSPHASFGTFCLRYVKNITFSADSTLRL